MLLPIPAIVLLQDQAPATLRALDSLLREVSQQATVRLFADSTLSGARLVAPRQTASAASQIEPWLTELVQAIPGGASWVKLWLPPAPRGKRWTGDEVAKYAMGLAQLYGTVGAVEEGKSEILATQLPDGPAQAVKDALKLQPVYLLTRRGTRTFAGKWSATFGELTLEIHGNRVTGTYPSSEGVLVGTLSGDRLTFTWTEHDSSSGRGWFVLSDDGESFSGKWGSGDEEPNRDWTGKRVYP
ncbi:hypothetical protein [Armatimonas rosea]|uniref:Uncharacterized protein n=1 Tax=Armatimonas rosea TaxID=685828 RepID=A0A7W9SS96_ARMRO|nr:hypothetical protein [Armatimonas rosea]MBB6051912.1 hypothetical protein [Armatimonas rosea]